MQVKSFDAALALTSPGNWLRKDLQHRVIGIFAADSNWEGLIEYYQGKLEATPNEPELLGLLAAAYIENQQLEEGISTYRKGLELAPTDANLRLNLIASLRNAEKFEDAAAEYEVLSKQDPDDFGIYRELGELYLQLENQDKAKTVYQKMIDRNPKNAGTHLILAEIYAGHEWVDDAVVQYEKAISLAPNNLDYIEYFGDFYLRQGNREKALETWNRMVADDNAIAANYDRLGQLFKAKNFKAEAIAAIRKTVELMPDEYRYHEALAKHLLENGDYDAALTEYTAAMKLAPNEFFAEKMNDKRIELYRRQGTLLDKIENIEAELEKPGLADTDIFAHHKQLAKMYLKLGNITYALEVLLKAKQFKPNDIGVNRWLATVYNRQGRRDEANAIYMSLIEIDSANAREYHAHIAKSYLNVMDFEAATASAKQMIANSPRNPEGHQLLAQIAKQSKNYDTAIDSLKQAIRLRPEAIDTRAELAVVYKLSGKLQQALAQYWRCWNLSDSVSDKLTFVKPLSEVYYDLGRRGDFAEKLKQMSKSNTSWVAPVLALAELHRMEGDLPSARFQLAQALNKQRENPELLSHLVQISIELGDIQDALTYQQHLVKVDPDISNQQKLGELLFDVGREQEAIQAWTKLLHAKNQTLEAEIKLAALLLRHGLSDEAFFVLERASEKITGTDAHLPLYRLGVMLVGMNESERARPYFHHILEMPEPPETANPNKQGTQSTIFSYSSIPGVEINKFEISRRTIGDIQSKPSFGGGGMSWIPKTFEETQAGALVHLTTIAQQQGKLTELVGHFEEDVAANPTDVKKLETLARLYTLIQYNEKAKEVFDKLIEISPNDLAYQPIRLQRAMQENGNYETLKKLLEGIPGLAPEARVRYIAEYAELLYYEDKKEDATKLLSEIEDVNATDIETGFKLVSAFHLVEKTDIAERILVNLPLPPQAKQREYRYLFQNLTDTYIRQGEPDKAVALLWTFCERTKPDSANPRRVASLALSTYYYGNYRPVQTSYPSPTAYFNQERLNYLRSIFREFWVRNQQEKLYTKFQKELDAAVGRDRIYPSLALSYCYWWDGKRDKAQEVLSTLQKEFSDDLTLKLNTAFVSIQTGKFREALIIVEEIAESEPRNRRQYNDLLLQLAIQTGDTVTLRELITKLLNSPTSAQELYEFSYNLQDAGFTQYAIAIAQKAMALAMTQRSPNFLMDLGEHLGGLGRGQDAARLAERALRFAYHPDRYGRTMYASNFQQATNLVRRSQNIKSQENSYIAEVEKNPESFQAQLKLAMFYESSDQINKAAEAFKAALALRPKDKNTRLRYVQMLEQSGKVKEAVPQYEILLKNDSSALGYDYEGAIDVFIATGKFDELISLTKDIILPVGQYAGNDFTQKVARRCLTENRPKDAVEIFEKILEVHPRWNYVYQELASAYVAAGEPEKAIQYLTEKHELGKTSLSQTSFQLKLAEFHEAAGGRERAIQFLREKTETGDLSITQSTVVLKLAEYYQKSGELEKFIAEYEAKLAEKPLEKKLLYILISMKIKANDIERANAHVSTLIDNVLMSFNTQWLYNLADTCKDVGAYDLQFRLLEATAEKLELENSWELSKCYRKLGEAYAMRDEMEKAQNAFRKMGTIQTMQDNSRSIYEKRQLASTYMQHEMWDDAETVYTEITNDMSASSYYREDAQEQLIEIYKQRGELGTTDQLAEKTKELDIGMQRLMAKEYERSNDLSKAVQIYEHIADSVPEDFESRAQLATVYSRINQHEKASETWTALLDADPENTKYQDGLVNSIQEAGKLNEAFDLAQKYVEDDPETGVHYVRMAKLYVNDGRLEDAVTAYEKAVELIPGNQQLWQTLAGLYLHIGDTDSADHAFKEAIRYTARDYDRERIEQKRIGLYRQIGKLDEMLLKAESENTISPEMQKTLAQRFRDTGNLEKAAVAYNKTLDITQNNYDRNGISNDLIDLYVKLGKTDAALEIYEKIVNSGSSNRIIRFTSSGIKLDYYSDRTREALMNAYKGQNQLKQLETFFEDKLDKDPENPTLLEMLAKIYNDAKDYKKAADTYIALSKADPINVRSFFRAAMLVNRMGQPELAKKLIEQGDKALTSSSKKDDQWVLAELATICYDNKMYTWAIKFGDSVLADSNGYRGGSIYETIYKILGKSYSDQKQYEEAYNVYKQMERNVTWSSARSDARSGMRKAVTDGKLYEKWTPEQLKKVEENPDDANALSELAHSYESSNKIKEAVEQYEKLNKLQPDNLQWYKKLGTLYQNLPPERRETGEVIEGIALTLPGGSWVEIDNSETLDKITEQVTVSAWIKPTDFPNSYAPIIFRGDERVPGVKNRSYILYLKNNGTIQMATSPGGGGEASFYSSNGAIKLNTWYHVACVIDAKKNVMKLFIDGIEVGNRNFRNQKSFYKSRLPLRIGWTHEEERPTQSPFVGQIDEVRVWNIARSEADIRSNMNTQFNGDEPGLVGYWKFDEETEGRISDSSLNKNDGKLIGNAKLESYTRPIFEILKSDDFEKTIAIYKKAIEQQPNSYEFYNLLAQIYKKKDDTPQVEAMYRRALKASLTQREYESAINAIQSLYADEDQVEKWIAILEEIKPKLEESAVLHELLGNSYKKTEDAEKAELAYAKWLKIRKRELNRQNYSRYYRDFAEKLIDRDMFPETALKFAKRASLSVTGSIDYLTTLGTAYLANGNYDDALEQFKMCVNMISSESEAEKFWKKLVDSNKKATNKNLYAEMTNKLINTISAENVDNRINILRGIAEFYSLSDMLDKAEMYVRKTGLIPENAWITLGPFDSLYHVGYEKSYISEQATYIDTTAKYYGKDELITWGKITDSNVNGLVYLGNNEWTAKYAWAIIISPDERDIIIRFDSDDQGTVWINGKQVFTHSRTSGVKLDRYSFPATLKQGENTFLVKVCNGTSITEFYMRLTDQDGNPIQDLKYKTADELSNATPTEPIFHVTSILGMVEYYSKNDMPDKALEQMRQTGIIHENAWLILGRFDNAAGIGYNTAYIPENTTQIDTTAKYEGVDGEVRWEKLTDATFNGYIDFGDKDNWLVSYAWATVNSPDEREVQLRFDSDDQGKIWLNGKEVFANPKAKAAIVDRNTIPVTLKAGKNTILVKNCNEELGWGFYLRITDADGKPFEDLKINDAQDN